jgi:hypothetical protein
MASQTRGGVTVDLRRRLGVLERHSADPLSPLSGPDARPGDPSLRRQLRECRARLRAEERTLEQSRQATRQIIALMRNMASDAGRETPVGRATGNLDDEWDVAFSALSENDVAELRAACEATLGRLRNSLV